MAEQNLIGGESGDRRESGGHAARDRFGRLALGVDVGFNRDLDRLAVLVEFNLEPGNLLVREQRTCAEAILAIFNASAARQR